ncbi:MAG: AAA family ATPase [Bdellovibrionales bacterium]
MAEIATPSESVDISAHTAKLSLVRKEIGKVIFGQNDVVDQTLISLMSGGHVLLIGVPGLAKTLLVETIASVLGLNSNRIQCTPDLMPADILGSEVLEEDTKGKRKFRFIEGPVFTQFLIADEINRASPRTQSALLQAMQENEVSVAGVNHKLPQPFHVLATQNPIEQEGTYPLPEAQLDRFLMQIDVDYPDEDTERQILLATTGNESPDVKAILDVEELKGLQHFVRDMPIGDDVVDAILKLVRHARPETSDYDDIQNFVTWAPGPRASQGFVLSVRARALLDGRFAPSIDDVVALAEPILKHRMALSYKAASQGITKSSIIKSLCESL